MDAQKSIERELKEVLRKIESAKSALAAEIAKGGNLPFAYSELQTSKQKLE